MKTLSHEAASCGQSRGRSAGFLMDQPRIFLEWRFAERSEEFCYDNSLNDSSRGKAPRMRFATTRFNFIVSEPGV
jgi:hypothetical protein